jgi:hypothetical protein
MLKSNRTAGKGILILLVIALMVPGLALASAEEPDVSSGVDVKIWGKAKFDMQYDTGQQRIDFMGYLLDDETEQLSFNPRDSRFGFKASSSQGVWTYSGVLELDFYGDNAGNNLLPRMRLGYAEAKNDEGLSIRGGQDWVPVAAQNPGTLDFGVQSWSGNLWWRVPQFTLRYKPKNIEFLASAMKHRVSNSQEQQEKMPWLLGRIGISDVLVEGSLLAIGGGVRSASDVVFESVAGPDTSDYSSSLIAFEFKFPLGGKFVLNGEVFSGQGIGREYVHYGLDYNPSNPGGGKEISTVGGFASLKFAASEKIEFNGGYGMDDPKDEDMTFTNTSDEVVLGGEYTKNQTIFVNMKYKVTKNFGWGLEFINFTTTVAQETDATSTTDLKGQRYTASWWYAF